MLSRWNIDSNLNVTSVMLAAKSEHSDNLIQRWVEPRSSCRAYAHLPDITTSTSFQSTSGLLGSTNFASQEQTSDCYPKPVVQSESHALSTNLPMLYRDIEFWKKIHWIPMSLTVITHEKNKIRQRSSLHKARRWEDKKPSFLPRTPLPPLEWAIQLFMWDGTVRWNLLCLFRVTGGRLSPKFCSRALAGQGQILRIDCLPILNRPLPILPKKQKNKRWSDWDYNQCTIMIFEMFSGHRSTPEWS